MGIYQYTCRSKTIDIQGIKIGQLAFAYKLGSQGYEPDSRYSNRTVRVLEAKAARARGVVGTDYFVLLSGLLNKKNLKTMIQQSRGKYPIYKLSPDTFQITECIDDPPVGYLVLDSNNKVDVRIT